MCTCAYVYVHMCVYVYYIHIHSSLVDYQASEKLFFKVCAYVYVCICVRAYVCVCILYPHTLITRRLPGGREDIPQGLCTVHMYICLYVYVYICVFVYYIHIHRALVDYQAVEKTSLKFCVLCMSPTRTHATDKIEG